MSFLAQSKEVKTDPLRSFNLSWAESKLSRRLGTRIGATLVLHCDCHDVNSLLSLESSLLGLVLQQGYIPD